MWRPIIIQKSSHIFKCTNNNIEFVPFMSKAPMEKTPMMCHTNLGKNITLCIFRLISAFERNPGRFGPGSFRPGSFRPGSFRPNLGVGRFGLGRWVDSALCRFGPGSFRPKIDR